MAKRTKLEPEEIPEVQAYQEAKEKLLRVKEAYHEVFEMLEPLVEDYNAKLEAAGKVVSAKGVDCGDFSCMSTAVTYDADKIYEIIGHEKFLEIGSITTKQVFAVEKNKIEVAIANGTVPEDVVSEVKKVSARYKKPKPILMP